jgi:hypothetical protein
MRIWISRGFVLLSLLFLTVLSSVLQNLSVQASPVLPSGGTLASYTPDEIVARAREWVKDHVEYNQQGYYRGLYREDCSGLVSMAWGISPSVYYGGLFTGTQPDNPDQQYALSSVANLLGKALDDSGKPIMSTMLKLQKGDILLNQVYIDEKHDYAHAILFVGWVDTQHKQLVSKPVIAPDGYYYYDGIEENGGIEKHADGTYSGYAIEHSPNYPVDTQPFDFHQPWPFPYIGFDPGGYYAWRFNLAKATKLGYIGQSSNTTPIASPPATTKPGGQWIPPSPKNGDTVSDVVHFAAQAYPAHQGDPAISLVYFTIDSNGSWMVVCMVSPPVNGNTFACDVNLKDAGISYGQIQVSFDVYDQAGNINLAPNGVHTLTYAPPPPSFTSSTWQGTATSSENGSSFDVTFQFTVNGNSFTGTEVDSSGGRVYGRESILNGRIVNSSTITYNTTTQVASILQDCIATIHGNKMTGSCTLEGRLNYTYTVYKTS